MKNIRIITNIFNKKEKQKKKTNKKENNNKKETKKKRQKRRKTSSQWYCQWFLKKSPMTLKNKILTVQILRSILPAQRIKKLSHLLSKLQPST